MDEVTLAYCERRMREERRAAEAAACTEAALAHQQLAQEFAVKADAIRLKAQQPTRTPLRSTLGLRHQ